MYKEIRKDIFLFLGCDTLKFPVIVLVYGVGLVYFKYGVIVQAVDIK